MEQTKKEFYVRTKDGKKEVTPVYSLGKLGLGRRKWTPLTDDHIQKCELIPFMADNDDKAVFKKITVTLKKHKKLTKFEKKLMEKPKDPLKKMETIVKKIEKINPTGALGLDECWVRINRSSIGYGEFIDAYHAFEAKFDNEYF